MPGSAPRVSVLLPVWNAAPFLMPCLESIARQTERDFECVLIDDGSSDGSLEQARRFAADDPRFRVFAEPHEGLVPSLLKGAEQCRAPLVARMDADDWMRRDRLERQADLLDARPELDATGSFVRLFPRTDLRDGRRRYEDWLLRMDDPETIHKERFIECPVAHPTLMLRRNRLLDLSYRDRGWPEDYDLLLRLLAKGPVVGMVPRRLVGWRDHPGRLSRQGEAYAQSAFTACRSWHLSQQILAPAGRRAAEASGAAPKGDYILWGHGRTGRALRKALAALGHSAHTIVEVHPRRIGQTIGGAPVIAAETLPRVPRLPILVSVAGESPRQNIREALCALSFEEGVDFFFAA